MSFLQNVTARLDSWVNLFTGLGGAADKATQFKIQDELVLDELTLAALFKGSDFANRIVSALPDRALKQGFLLSAPSGDLEPEQAADEADDLLRACDGFMVKEKFKEAMTWGRLYGFGGIVMGVEGSGSPSDPLDDERASKLLYLLVVDKREMIPASFYDDPLSDKFGEVETYKIVPTNQTGSTIDTFATIPIHESRVIRFGGALTSRRERQENRGSDYSVLQRVYTVLQQAEQNWAGICHLMTDISQGVFKIDGLIGLLASGQDALLQKRMSVMQYGRSIARSVVLDAEKEAFERVATPLAGVPEILEQTWKRLAAAAEMPLTVLMGVSPAGLNATGESDLRLWYDSIQSQREHVLGPRIERIVRLIAKTLGHADPEGWKVSWPSLWQMTAPERADFKNKIALADKTYIDAGVLLPEEVALSRFRGRDFNGEHVQIDADAREAAMKRAVDELVNPPPPPMPLMPGTKPKQLAASKGKTPPVDESKLKPEPNP